MTEFVLSRSKEDTNNTPGVPVAVHGDVVGEWFVVQTVLTSLDQGVPSLFVATNGHSVVEHGFKVVEVSGKLVHGYGLHGHAGEAQFLRRVSREVLFVSDREIWLC